MKGKGPISPDYLIKVGNGAYLSKHDPRFLEKYVRFFPHDGEKLYEYAQQLVSQGKRDLAKDYFRKAANEGYFGGIKASGRQVIIEKNEPKKQSSVTLLLWINSILLLLLLLFIGHLFYTEMIGNRAEEAGASSLSHIRGASKVFTAEQADEKKFPLGLIALNQAIEGYEDYYHRYPIAIEELTKPYPNNWISTVPAGVDYQMANDGYELYWRGEEVSSLLPPLQLIFYQGSNTLVLMSGEEAVASFSVAAGVKPLPFTTSAVSARVVNPNGGKGALGTRGLVLHDQYAIHGTNQPSLIGKNVSLGCLRMSNEEIEALYPYIPQGTPFIVNQDSFQDDTMLTSIPFLEAVNTEQAQGELFAWRQ